MNNEEVILREAKDYLEAMKEHKTCCGTEIIRNLLEVIKSKQATTVVTTGWS